MAKYICKRILMMIPVLLGVILVVFIMNHISPGNPAKLLAGEGATEEAVEAPGGRTGVERPALHTVFQLCEGHRHQV